MRGVAIPPRRSCAAGVCLGLLLAAGAQRPAGAAEGDAWFARDKALHFSASAVIAGGGYAAASPFTEHALWRALVGAGLGVTAGMLKEGIDATRSGDPSWRDFSWDLVGTAVGVGVAACVDWLVRR